MIRRAAGALTLVLAVPSGAGAQCAIDIVEEGIRAYRELDLQEAEARLRDAVAVNRRDSSPCATETARALTYLGATHWLAERVDSAEAAFERAVVHAPRFRPDGFEFPPEIRDLFDLVREATPSVATNLPADVVIGPEADEALSIRLTASTHHTVQVRIEAPGQGTVRTLYEGPVTTDFDGTILEWDGRRSTGQPVGSGRYDLEVLSLDERQGPVRKVVIALTVDSNAPPPPDPAPDTASFVTSRAPASSGGLWRAIAAGGAGLVGGGLIIGMPHMVPDAPDGWVRYPIAVSVGVAGIVGLVEHLSGDDGDPFTRDSLSVLSAQELEDERRRRDPTLRISVGSERRVELSNETDGRGAALPGRGPGLGPVTDSPRGGSGAGSR